MRFIIEDDFDLGKIHNSGQCFRWEERRDGTYRIPGKEHCLRIRKTTDKEYEADCTEEEFSRYWRDYFDLAENYESIRLRIEEGEDPFLHHAAEAEKGIRILRQDPWETLVSFIISQNRNIPAIRRSIEWLCRIAGEQKLDRAGEEWYSFPSPEAVARAPESDLALCRLGYRAPYVKAAAESALHGDFDAARLQNVPDDELMEELTKLYGVGVKVASCVVLFGFHRLDAFPIDTWVRKVLDNEYPDGYPFERYRPFNGVCQQYMFACYRDRER